MKFNFNPQNVDLGFPVFNKGTYEMEIGEPKTFFREAKDGKDAAGGISVLLTVTEGEMKGKKYPVQFDLSKDYGEQNVMALLTTAAGFDANEEGVKAFRELHGDKSFSVDLDSKSLGDGWDTMKGQRVYVEFDSPQPRRDDPTKLQNSFPKYLPKK